MRKRLSGIGKAFGIVWNADRIYPFLLLIRALAEAVMPLFLSVCVSRLVSGMAGERRINDIILTLFLLLFGTSLLKALSAWLDWQCSYRYMCMQDVFTEKNSMKAMRMEYQATESAEVTDLYTHAWSANIAPGTIVEQVFSVFGGVVQMLGCIGIILRLGAVLLGIVAVLIAVYCLLDERMGARRRQFGLEVMPLDRMIGYTRGCMGDASCAKDIRLYYHRTFFLNRLQRYQNQKMEKQTALENRCAQGLSLQAVLQMAQTVALYAVLMKRFLEGGIAIGYFSLAVSSIGILMGAIRRISACWNQMNDHVVSLTYLERFRSLPERFDGDRTSSGGMLRVTFKDVWFRYPGADQYALEAVNVTLDKGEIMAIVGENGSGKTTFVKLLLGLYRPTRGEILLNGVHIDRYTDEAYRKMFAPVFQDYRLFAYTLRENLVFDGAYHKEKVDALLKELGMEQKISSLPDGMEQHVGKGYEQGGVVFSGGEGQKIAIARALLKENACVVLDEPTAALDPLAEMELYRQINRLAGEKACVLITHRLAGVHFSNRILFFEKGRIAEQGNCQELLEREGKFYAFYRLQARMYEPLDAVVTHH